MKSASLMCSLAAVIFGVCCFNTQATTSTTAIVTTNATNATNTTAAPASTSSTSPGKSTSSTSPGKSTSSTSPSKSTSSTSSGNTYTMEYEFNLYTNPPLDTASPEEIKKAADVAVYGLNLHGAVQPVANPTRTTQKINGDDQPVWDILLNIQFPNDGTKTVVTQALSAQSFSTELEYQLRRQPGLDTADITFAQLSTAGGGFVPVAIPTTVAPVTTTTTAQECGKSPLVGGLLTLFLGGLGAGRFYYGYIALGVAWLFWTLFAHIGSSVGGCLLKCGGCAGIVGGVVIGLAVLSEIGCFIWWIHDLVVIFGKTLKPYDESDCVF